MCRAEQPGLGRVARANEDKVLFFGVAWRGSEAECRSYVEEFDVPYDNALDADEKVFGAYGFNHQPATVFVTRDGRILRKHFGPLEPDEIQAAIDAISA